MLSAIALSLAYKGLLTLHNKGTDLLFSPAVYAVFEKIDTSVFGVAVSIAAFFCAAVLMRKNKAAG